MVGRARVAIRGFRGGQNTRQSRRGREEGKNLGFDGSLRVEENSQFGATIQEENGGNGGMSNFRDGTSEIEASGSGGVQYGGGFNGTEGRQSRAFTAGRGRESGVGASLDSNGQNRRNDVQRSGIQGSLGFRGGARINAWVGITNDVGGIALGSSARRQNNASDGSAGAAKGLSFTPEEERQLTRFVMAILQDKVIGNQHKFFSFWKRNL